jgi:hypothetical protein
MICISMAVCYQYRIKQIYENGKPKYIPQQKVWLCYYKDVIEDNTHMVFYTLDSCRKYVNNKILSECDLVVYHDI